MNPNLQNALQIFLLGLLTIIGKFIIDWIRVKQEEIKLHSKNELANKYIDMVTQTVTNCVIATNQTYVDNLKNQDIFDKEAQKEAFNKTLNTVLAILSDDVVSYLDEFTGDAEQYLTTLIEAEVAKQKQEKGSI